MKLRTFLIGLGYGLSLVSAQAQEPADPHSNPGGCWADIHVQALSGDSTPPIFHHLGEISRFNLSLLRGDMEHWMSSEVEDQLRDLMEQPDLNDFERCHLEAASLCLDYARTLATAEQLKALHMQLLEYYEGNVLLDLVGKSARIRLKEWAADAEAVGLERRNHTWEHPMMTLVELECQAVVHAESRKSLGWALGNSQPTDWHGLASTYPTEFSEAMANMLHCQLPEPGSIRHLYAPLYIYMIIQHKDGTLTREEGRQFVNMFPLEAMSDSRVIEIALGQDPVTLHEYVESKWKPAMVTMLETQDKHDLIPFALSLIDLVSIYHQDRHIEKKLPSHPEGLYYYDQAFSLIDTFLTEFPTKHHASYEPRTLLPTIEGRLSYFICIVPLRRFQSIGFSSDRKNIIYPDWMPETMVTIEDNLRQRLAAGDYGIERYDLSKYHQLQGDVLH
jgi:hypothetical protein